MPATAAAVAWEAPLHTRNQDAEVCAAAGRAGRGRDLGGAGDGTGQGRDVRGASCWAARGATI